MTRFLLAAALFCLLLSACSSPAPAPAQASPTPAPSLTSAPAAAPPTLTPTRPDLPTAPPLTEPAVLARSALAPGAMGEVLTSSPGRVWVGTTFGAIEEHDAASGALLKVHALLPGAPNKPTPVKALAFDGQNLWALVESIEDNRLVTHLYVLALNGDVLYTEFLPDTMPLEIGLAPGQVWVQGAVYSTQRREPVPVEMQPSPAVFAFDGRQMWVAGATTCDDCPTAIYHYALSAPFAHGFGPKASPEVSLLAVTETRLWAVTTENRLDGYSLDAGLDTAPLTSLDLSAEMEVPPSAAVFDGRWLWLLSSTGQGGGMLYQHDPISGALLSALPVGDSDGGPGTRARIPIDLVFDGSSLWVLTAYDLARVGLPPVR